VKKRVMMVLTVEDGYDSDTSLISWNEDDIINAVEQVDCVKNVVMFDVFPHNKTGDEIVIKF